MPITAAAVVMLSVLFPAKGWFGADQWLAGVIQQGGVGNTRKVLHGMFTYDFQAIILALTDEQGNLVRPNLWKRVDFPLALVTFGETATVPWEQ